MAIILTHNFSLLSPLYKSAVSCLAHFSCLAKYDIHIMESLPGVLGNRGNDIYSRGTGNKGQILSGTGYKGNIGEQGI